MSDAREEPRAVEVASHAHGLLRDVLIYGAGGVGLQLLLSLLVPIFTRIFTTEDYGTIEAIATTVLVLSLLATLGLESASQRSYFDYGDEQTEERRSVLSTTFWVLLSTSVVWGGAIVVFRGPLAELLFDDRGPATALALAGAALPLTILAGFFLEVLRMRRRPTSYTLVALLAGVVGVAFALLFAGVLDHGLPGYYAGLLVGGAVAVLVGFELVRDSLGFTFDAGKLRVMLAYGLPLVPVAASTWVLQFVDRYFLLHYSTRADLGLYGVGARLSNFLLLGVTAFALAWSPFMLELHHRDAPAERAARGRVLTLLVIALCFGALVLSVYAREILRIFTPAPYHGAYVVVGLLAGSIVALGANAVTMSEISLKRRTIFFTRYAIYAAALNIALNFLLIPAWDIVGAALATLITYGALAAMYYWRAQRLEAAPFEPRSVVLVIAVTAVLVAVGTFVHFDSLWLSVFVKLPLVLAFPAVLRLVGVLEPGWLTTMLEWTRTFLREGVRAPA